MITKLTALLESFRDVDRSLREQILVSLRSLHLKLFMAYYFIGYNMNNYVNAQASYNEGLSILSILRLNPLMKKIVIFIIYKTIR